MSDTNQVGKLILPLCVNVGAILLPVTHVRKELKDLNVKRDAIAADIEATDPEEVSALEKLKRDLAGVDAAITRMDDPMKARLGHVYPPTNSA
jgi:hypothetical protein